MYLEEMIHRFMLSIAEATVIKDKRAFVKCAVCERGEALIVAVFGTLLTWEFVDFVRTTLNNAKNQGHINMDCLIAYSFLLYFSERERNVRHDLARR